MISRPYRVVNLSQAGPDMISTKDFNSFFNNAVAQANAIATIARSHGLSDDEENQVRRAVGTLQQYTIPMTPCPAEVQATGIPISSGIPWWAAALAGLGVGGAAVGLLL